MIAIEFEARADDVAHATKLVVRRAASQRASPWMLGAAGIAPLLVVGGSSGSWLLGALVAAAVVTAFWWLISVGAPLLAARSARRAFARHPEYQGVLRYAFSETGVELTTPMSRLELVWAVFTRAHEDGEFLYLDAVPPLVYFVPKRGLSAETSTALRTLIRDRLGERAAGLAAS